MKDKKVWFIGYTSRFWVPVSIEGWLVTVVSLLSIGIILKSNNVSGNVPFSFSSHWPMLVEIAVLILVSYFITKGHVDKRY